MTLESIGPTRRRTPDRILLIGVEGVGKSTFSSQAPSTVFIASEEGLAEIEAHAFPEPKTFGDVLAAIDVLITSDHQFKTLSIDTIDWIEPLIWEHVIAGDGKAKNIEEVGGGYGKGYTAATAEWRLMLGRLQELWAKRAMEIHLLAHAAVTPFKNPAGPDFDRYEPKIHKKGGGTLIKEWVKTILFATFEEWTVEAQKGEVISGVTSKKKVKGVASGARIIHTQRTAAWDGKNRYNLPPTLPLDYAAYAEAREAGIQAAPSDLYSECISLLSQLGLGEDAKQRQFVEKNKENPEELARALNRLRVEVAESNT